MSTVFIFLSRSGLLGSRANFKQVSFQSHEQFWSLRSTTYLVKLTRSSPIGSEWYTPVLVLGTRGVSMSCRNRTGSDVVVFKAVDESYLTFICLIHRDTDVKAVGAVHNPDVSAGN